MTDTIAGITDTLAFALDVGWATLCAVTVTEPEGTFAGAVYIPDEETVPTVAFPPAVPLTIQLTAVLLLPETEAVNCWVWLTRTLEVVGETETVTGGGAVTLMLALAEADG